MERLEMRKSQSRKPLRNRPRRWSNRSGNSSVGL